MAEILIMGELLVEIMRPKEEIPLFEPDWFRGPFPSGAPGIFISTAARLGHSAAIISGVGRDDFGETILRRLKADGVDVSRVLISDQGNTGVAFVTYFADGGRKFLFYMDGSPCVIARSPEDLTGLEDVRYMHVMGCSLMSSVPFAEEMVRTMNRMMEQGAKISFDPNVRLEMMRDPQVLKILREVAENASVLMPGTAELKMITGEEDPEKAVQKAFENPALELLVLKNGSEGSAIYTRDGLALKQGIYPVRQEDATGAGDSYDAAFICGLAEGKSLREAAQMGAAAGALNAAAFGPMEGKISRETVAEMIRKYESGGNVE